MNPKKCIFITTQYEGFHKYPDAPEEVSFLRSLHRHLFHVRAEIEVYHNDRELEFILVKRKVDQRVSEMMSIEKNTISCEYVAEALYYWIKDVYGKERAVKVEVNEDNENGSIIGDY